MRSSFVIPHSSFGILLLCLLPLLATAGHRRVRHFNPRDAGAAMAVDSRFGFALNDGDAVSTWEDRTNNNNDVTGSSTTRPLWKTAIQGGQPALLFDGSNDYMDMAGMSGLSTGDVTIISVWQRTATSPTWQAAICLGVVGEYGVPQIGRRDNTTQVGAHDVFRADVGTFIDLGADALAWNNSCYRRTGGTAGNGGDLDIFCNATFATSTQSWTSSSNSTARIGCNNPASDCLAGYVAVTALWSSSLGNSLLSRCRQSTAFSFKIASQ